MNAKRNLMWLLALIVVAFILASCCSVSQRPPMIATPATTALETFSPPVATTITELQLKGDQETLTVHFDPDKGTCKDVKTSLEKDLSCDDVQIELNQLFICTLKSKAEWHQHKVNTVIEKTAIPGLLAEGQEVYCAQLTYLSEGAVFQFLPDGGNKKNIRCRKSGGAPICPR